MFGLFKSKPKDRGLPPTQKQLGYAKSLGIESPEQMSRVRLSDAIDKASINAPPTKAQLRYAKQIGVELRKGVTHKQASQLIHEAIEKDPEVRRRVEKIEAKQNEAAEKKYIEKVGPEVDRIEQLWRTWSEDFASLLVVYVKKDQWIVDLVAPVDPIVNEQRKSIRLGFVTPKVVKDRDMGEHLEWDVDRRPVTIAPNDLLYWEATKADPILPMTFDFSPYQKRVQRGLKIAEKIRKGKIDRMTI